MTTPSLQESFPVALGDKTYRFIPTMKFVFRMGELEDLMGGDDRSAAAGMRGHGPAAGLLQGGDQARPQLG